MDQTTPTLNITLSTSTTQIRDLIQVPCNLIKGRIMLSLTTLTVSITLATPSSLHITKNRCTSRISTRRTRCQLWSSYVLSHVLTAPVWDETCVPATLDMCLLLETHRGASHTALVVQTEHACLPMCASVTLDFTRTLVSRDGPNACDASDGPLMKLQHL